MEDITKSFQEKVARFEKEGTPVRSFATCGRLFIESAYKAAVGTFSPVKVQSLYAERVHLVAHSLNVFKQNNEVRGCYCYYFLPQQYHSHCV
jgi:hypothetical protein